MDAERVIDWLLALSIGGILVELLRAVIHRKKMNADYADVIAASAIRLLGPLEERIKSLETELRNTKRTLAETKHELVEARREIRTLSRALSEYDSTGRESDGQGV